MKLTLTELSDTSALVKFTTVIIEHQSTELLGNRARVVF